MKSQRAAHHSIPALYRWEWVGLLKNTLTVITKEASLYPCIGGNWVGLLKNTLTNKNHKRAAHHYNPAS
jgi:hypothetical protein